VIACIYKATIYLDTLINPTTLVLPNSHLYTVARIALWALYGFWAGLFATGIWVIGHECGHQSFSESKTINNTVGWILHSACVIARNIALVELTRLFFSRLGVPYHAWRITHSKHHASTGHMTQDQVFVPPTRSDLGLPTFDPSKEDLLGARVVNEVKKEMWEALGDSPIGAALGSASYLVSLWPPRLGYLKHSFFVYL
jgi:omega-6 fatty acid desaturase (delta-12 desaturase)